MSSSRNLSSINGCYSGIKQRRTNVSDGERWLAGLSGGALALYGIKRKSAGGLLMTMFGAGLIYTGVSGYCDLYRRLGINTAHKSRGREPVARDVHIETSIVIDRPLGEVYRFWRNLENLPRFMDHLESVTMLDGERSHWVVKGPLGETEEWDAEIYNEKENELISWRSLPGSDVTNAGTVRFDPAPGGGTHARILMNYNVLGGRVTSALARFLGQAPVQLINDDLQRLKQILESSDVTEGAENEILDLPEAPKKESGESARGGTLIGRAHSNLT